MWRNLFKTVDDVKMYTTMYLSWKLSFYRISGSEDRRQSSFYSPEVYTKARRKPVRERQINAAEFNITCPPTPEPFTEEGCRDVSAVSPETADGDLATASHDAADGDPAAVSCDVSEVSRDPADVSCDKASVGCDVKASSLDKAAASCNPAEDLNSPAEEPFAARYIFFSNR